MWLAPKLKQRIQIQKPIQTAKASGLTATTYETLATIWAAVEPVSDYLQAVRGVQNAETPTHKFKIRAVAISVLGKAFEVGFDTGYKNMSDINQIKSDWFLFMEQGSTAKGTRYRIKGMQRDDSCHEFINILAKEYQEAGTGYPLG